MSNIVDPFSNNMYASQQASLLEAAFGHCLNLELDQTQMNAQRMGEFATTVAASISDHYDELSAALPQTERQHVVERLAEDNGMGTRSAVVEYLSNAYMFRVIRDYFGLPRQDIFPQLDIGGFLAFTGNGSIVASPPEDDLKRRTFHYTRMPSRRISFQTSSQNGGLLGDVRVGHRLKATSFHTSAIQRLLYIPASKAGLFETIRRSMIASSLSVSAFVSRVR